MKFFLGIFFSVMCSYIKASISWSLQTTDPSFVMKNYQFDHKKHKIFLPKTSWYCQLLETHQKDQTFSRSLNCYFKQKKLSSIKTEIFCSPKFSYNERKIILTDHLKKLTFSLLLQCQLNPPKA